MVYFPLLTNNSRIGILGKIYNIDFCIFVSLFYLLETISNVSFRFKKKKTDSICETNVRMLNVMKNVLFVWAVEQCTDGRIDRHKLFFEQGTSIRKIPLKKPNIVFLLIK